MSSQIRITVLVDNIVSRPVLLAEHGLAIYIEAAEKRILLDTGQSGVLLHNAAELGIDLRTLDAIVLSHGHYDHTGGLSHVLELAPQAQLYLHPQALAPKYSCPPGGSSRSIGMSDPLVEILKQRKNTYPWIATEKPTEIAPGVLITGPIPRITDFEDTGGPFYLDGTGKTPDPLTDDQAMIIESSEGLIVLCGCAHSGVVNILHYVEQLTGSKQIIAIIGGLHLQNASENRIHHTLDAIRSYQVRQIVLAHCTGISAATRFCDAFAGACSIGSVGSEYFFSTRAEPAAARLELPFD